MREKVGGLGKDGGKVAAVVKAGGKGLRRWKGQSGQQEAEAGPSFAVRLRKQMRGGGVGAWY